MENNRLILRDALPEELDKVSLLIRDAYIEYKDFLPPEQLQFYLADIMDVRSRLADSQLIVAEFQGQLAGTVTLYIDASRSSQEGWPRGWAGIRLLAVHPAYRGRGIGLALMEECIRRCREQKIKTIGLHTTTFMNIALRMYEKIGFVRVPKYDFRPRPGVVVMAYRLRL